MIRVAHGSDWHGYLRALPECDLVVLTGDMLRNYPVKNRDPGSYGYREYHIEPAREVEKQTAAMAQIVSEGGFQRYLSNPNTPIVVVRGNHDFVDLAPMFEGCNLVHEFLDNEAIEVLGLMVTGHRGIPYIGGTWADETPRPELIDRMRRLPEADLILTHYPPAGILDAPFTGAESGWGDGWVEGYGLEGMASVLNHKLRPGGVHCFGHIHESGCKIQTMGDVRFSNAAMGINVFDIDPDAAKSAGWTKE